MGRPAWHYNQHERYEVGPRCTGTGDMVTCSVQMCTTNGVGSFNARLHALG